MKGRKLGNIDVTLDEITKIKELTEQGLSRPQIAKEINRGKTAIYYWQKKLGLV